MNILTIDIEEWFAWEALNALTDDLRREHDIMLGRLLDLLDSAGTKATFFCVGMMGRNFPEVIRKIYERGHEIGCHSNLHTWLNKMTPEECLEDTRAAIDNLQQCIGEKVLSYRAPAFSIGENNRWVFEILSECGITRDSSVFPAKREFGGFPSFGEDAPSLIVTKAGTIKEFPISVTSFMGRKTAFSGGGYFRFFPYGFVSRRMKKRDYNICYFHMSDFVKEKKFTKEEYETYFKEKASSLSLFTRSVKMNLGKERSWSKFSRLLDDFRFVTLEEADKLIQW
ncbi:MAG: polysaccharide deacetylase family protein [Bacteroidales bacterium]|nr:polysaccharide deacetylase family protein [Bacteroidales bacterium]